MFKNHSIQMKMVKDASQQSADDTVKRIDPEQINKIARDNVLLVATAVGAILLSKRLLDTASEIAVLAAKAKLS